MQAVSNPGSSPLIENNIQFRMSFSGTENDYQVLYQLIFQAADDDGYRLRSVEKVSTNQQRHERLPDENQ